MGLARARSAPLPGERAAPPNHLISRRSARDVARRRARVVGHAVGSDRALRPRTCISHRMSFRMVWFAVGVCATFASPRTVCADEASVPARPMTLGFNLDLLPMVLSAANGRLGYTPQVWLRGPRAGPARCSPSAAVTSGALQETSFSILGRARIVLNPQTVSLGAFDYRPFPLQAEVSMKIGGYVPI
jgi:hypothetical protein